MREVMEDIRISMAMKDIMRKSMVDMEAITTNTDMEVMVVTEVVTEVVMEDMEVGIIDRD